MCYSFSRRAALKYGSHSHVKLLQLLQSGGGSKEREGTREKRRRDRAPFTPAHPPAFHCISNLHFHNTALCLCSVSALSLSRALAHSLTHPVLFLSDKGPRSCYSSSGGSLTVLKYHWGCLISEEQTRFVFPVSTSRGVTTQESRQRRDSRVVRWRYLNWRRTLDLKWQVTWPETIMNYLKRQFTQN